MFVVQCETAGGFLVFFVFLRRLRVPHTDPCAKPAPLPTCCGGREPKKPGCFARAIVFGIGSSAPPSSPSNNVDTTVTGRGCIAQWWFSPPPNLAPPSLGHKGWEVWYNVISLKKANTNFFVLEEGPSLKFFFSRLVYRNRNLVVVVDACFTGVKRKKKDLTDERGTNYSDAIFY